MSCMTRGKETVGGVAKCLGASGAPGAAGGTRHCNLCGGFLTGAGLCRRCGGNGFPKAELYRVRAGDAMGWDLHGGESLDDAIEAEVRSVTNLGELERAWESVGGDDFLGNCFELDVRLEGEEFVVYLEDDTGGYCPHDLEPAACARCREAQAQGRRLFWMESGRGGLAWSVGGITVGDDVQVPEPENDDLWNHSFEGRVASIVRGVATVVDQDGDAWDVDVARLAGHDAGEGSETVRTLARTVVDEYGDDWVDGYTSDEADVVLRALNQVVGAAGLPGRIVLVWEKWEEGYGPTGDSDLFYVDADRVTSATAAYSLVNGDRDEGAFLKLLAGIRRGEADSRRLPGFPATYVADATYQGIA